jgi:arylsulfatase A-like enzyme
MSRQNLLVICSDEHQARAMRCAGHGFDSTLNLDALAARGTRLAIAITPRRSACPRAPAWPPDATCIRPGVGTTLCPTTARFPAGASDDTTVIYTSDHGDNVGARGLWGKSNFYEESVAISMIMAGADVPTGNCETPVSLLDLSATIADHFGVPLDGADGIRPLPELAATPYDPERAVFSEYHGTGSVSGG